MPNAISSRQPTPSAFSESPSLDSVMADYQRERLLAAASSRGMPTDITLDPAWEQYLKEQAERGELALSPQEFAARMHAAALQQAMQNGGPTSASRSQAVPPEGLQQSAPSAQSATATA